MSDIKNRLLVLDGEPDIRQELMRRFEAEGFEIVRGLYVRDGLELLNSSFFDVVVTALSLPDGSGAEVLRFCSQYCPRTKVICIIDRAVGDNADLAVEYGADYMVSRPCDPDILFHAVKRCLRDMNREEAAGLEKQRYKALVNELSDGYFLLEDRKLIYANRAMASMLRCSVAELAGSEFTSLVMPEMGEKLRLGLDALETGRACVWQEELVLCDAGGNEILVDVRLSLSNRGRRVLSGMCREITEKDMLWERLVRAEKFALMGEMTAGIAHELNNKLTPILGFVELLRMSISDTESRGKIDAIYGAALGARKIVQSLLSFARRKKKAPVPVNVNSLIETSIALVQSSFVSSGVEVNLDLEPGLLTVKADAVEIEQVLANLFKNAFEAMGESGQLTVESRREGPDVVITVRDTGPGIPPEIQSRIFKPFFTTKDHGTGTGLGLSICNGIIRNHGGRLDVQSCSKGTVFMITLPAATERVRNSSSSTHSICKESMMRRTAGSATHVPSMLVVDDEPEIGRLFKELFCYKFDIEVVENGRKAIERIGNRDFDIIISDIKMPEIDGIEFHKILADNFPRYLNRIIYTTGVTFDPKASAFLSRTGVPYLSKPFKVAHLMKLVTRMLEKQEGKQAVA